MAVLNASLLVVVALLARATGPHVGGEHELYRAIETGDVNVLRAYLEGGGDPNRLIKRDKDTTVSVYPLEIAVASRQDTAATILLRTGAKADVFDTRMGDFLELSAQQGMASSIRQHLAQVPGALDDPSRASRVLNVASAYGRFDVVSVIIEQKAGRGLRWDGVLERAFIAAASAGSEDIARRLLETGLDSQTPGLLHAVAYGCNAGLVRDVVEAGAPITGRAVANGRFEQSPLQLAVERLDKALGGAGDRTTAETVIEQLADLGADVCPLASIAQDLKHTTLRTLKRIAPHCHWSPDPKQ